MQRKRKWFVERTIRGGARCDTDGCRGQSIARRLFAGATINAWSERHLNDGYETCYCDVCTEEIVHVCWNILHGHIEEGEQTDRRKYDIGRKLFWSGEEVRSEEYQVAALVDKPAGGKRRQRHNGRGNMKGKKGKGVLMK